jgi:hypothetical protein
MTDKKKQIDEMAKIELYRAVNGQRCLRSGYCTHCGAHKAATNPKYQKCDCYRIAEIIFDAGYRKQRECKDVSKWRGVFECSECHWTDEDIGTADQILFCAGCGAKVKGGE